jgi:hypothetical protein
MTAFIMPRTRCETSIKQKRLDFIIAAQNLGIDKYSLAHFLENAISTEEKFLETAQPAISLPEYKERTRGLMEADLVRLILVHF